MSRSGYSEDCCDTGAEWAHIRWRGQVASAIRGARGQTLLKELLAALDAMPEKRLIANNLRNPVPPSVSAYQVGSLPPAPVCAMGCLGEKRGIRLEELDPDDYIHLGRTFGVAHQLIMEIEYMNDDAYWDATEGQRWNAVRNWVASQIKGPEHV